jgi:Ethanolamine utilization protein EutJ (predicted chaperonin)
MMWLGIDFGTCYSSAAFIRHGVLTPVKFGANITSMPSSVYLDKGGKLLVGKAAENKRQLDPSRYRREFKREFGNSTPYTIGDREFLPEELVTELLRRLKSEADAQSPDGQSFSGAVITVPANYQKGKRELMIEAGRAAGFASVLLLDEPVAAAVYHASQSGQSQDGETILVYDLGGGTFDAALIRKEGDAYEPLGLSVGHDRLGGIDFDRKIFEDLLARCSSVLRDILTGQETAGDESRLTRLRARQFVADECRELKHHLSEDEEQTLTFPYAPLDEYTLTRAEFERMIAPLIAETCDICRRLVSEARIEWEQVARILLVGGSCRIPYVRHALERELKRPALRVDDPELAVCLGAALWEKVGTSRANREEDMTVLGSRENRIEAAAGPALREGEKRIFLPEGDYKLTPILALSPDGRSVARATAGRVELWDLRGEQLIYKFETEWPNTVWAGFSPDGRELLVQSHRQQVEYRLDTFETSTGKFVRRSNAHMSPIVCFSPNAKYSTEEGRFVTRKLFGGHKLNHWMTLRHIEAASQSWSFNTGGDTSICAFSPDGKLFAYGVCGIHRYLVNILDIERNVVTMLDSEQVKGLMKNFSGFMSALCFSPDGKTIACSYFTLCLARDVATGKVLWWDSYGTLNSGPYALKFSPDGKLLAFLESPTIKIYESASGKLLHSRSDVCAGYPALLEFWPDGRTLAFRGDKGTLALWRLP